MFGSLKRKNLQSLINRTYTGLKVLEAGSNLPAGRPACLTSENTGTTTYYLKIPFQFQILNISPAFLRKPGQEILPYILT